jgi:hypothetical protein
MSDAWEWADHEYRLTVERDGERFRGRLVHVETHKRVNIIVRFETLAALHRAAQLHLAELRLVTPPLPAPPSPVVVPNDAYREYAVWHLGDTHIGKGETDEVNFRARIQRVGERMFGGPADLVDGGRRAAGAEADQPVAAILGRAEHRIRSAQGAERRREVGTREVGDVAAHQHRAPMPPERAAHPDAKIAPPLPHAMNPARPARGAVVGRDGQLHPPARIAGKPQRAGQLGAVEAQRRHRPDPARQPPLHGAEPRGAREQDHHIAPHQPLPA